MNTIRDISTARTDMKASNNGEPSFKVEVLFKTKSSKRNEKITNKSRLLLAR